MPLIFTERPEETLLYGSLGHYAHEFESHGYTYNAHHWAVRSSKMETDQGLKSFWDQTAISFVPNNGTDPMAFVASMEAKDYPIFTTQYHPEKPSQLWTDNPGINHEWESIDLQKSFEIQDGIEILIAYLVNKAAIKQGMGIIWVNQEPVV